MNDRRFLLWIHERLEHVHRENPALDYMYKLRSIIEATPEEQDTPNTSGSGNSRDLRRKLYDKVI